MKKLLQLTAIFIVTLNATETYTIDELILKALKNAPELQISAASVSASQSRLDQANANYLPSVDLSVSAGQGGRSDIPTNPNTMITDTLILGKLSLQQLVYDFGKTDALSDAFKYSSQSYANDYQQLISDKKKNVKNAYYTVLQKLALIKVNEENVKLNKAQLYRSQKYFQAGIRTKIDVSDAKVELIKSEIDLKNSQHNLELSYANLDKELGLTEIENDYKVYAQELDLTQLYSSLHNYALSLNEAVNFAYTHRYELKKQLSEQQVSQAQYKNAKSGYYPSIFFNANYTKQKLDTFKDALPQDQWQALVNLNVNLYKGGATDAQTQEKSINVKIANASMQNSRLLIKAQTKQAYINVNKSKDSVELSQSLLKVSKEKFGQASKRYEHGLSDFIELQQARQGYIDAMASLVITYYNYYGSVSVLDNAIGK